MQPHAPVARTTLSYVSLALLLILFAFVYVWSFMLGWRAIFLVHAGALFLLGCGIFIRHLPSFLLFVMVFVFPMDFGFHLLLAPLSADPDLAEVSAFANGLRIDSSDVILMVLYVHWALRLAYERLNSGGFSLGRPIGSVLLIWIVYVLVAGMIKAHERSMALFEVFVLFRGFLFFLYLVNNLTTLRDFRIVYYALLATNVFHALFMLGQYATGLNYDIHGVPHMEFVEREGFRPAGFIGCPNCSAAMIDVILPLALTHFLVERDLWKRLGILVCVGILCAGLMATKVRISLAAVIVFSLVVLGVSQLRGWISWKRMTAILLAGIVLLIAVSPLMVQRFKTGDYGEDRMPLIYTAVNMIKGNPLLGVGVNNYKFRIYEYVPRELAGKWVYVVHNEFLSFFAETGLIGVALYYVLLALAMVRSWRLTYSSDPWIFILSCGFFSAFVGSLPQRITTSYMFESMFILYSITLAMICAMQRFEGKR